ncbi:MAG: c(7)-type cytochrome triheme domain-containing protein [Nitrospirota bacterium]
MRIVAALLTVLVAVVFVGSAMAVAPGKTVEYAGGAMGKVVFDGKVHGAEKGMKCNDCHTKVFPMKKGSFKMTKDDHGKDMACGTCHNGTKTFGMTDAASCAKCHKK